MGIQRLHVAELTASLCLCRRVSPEIALLSSASLRLRDDWCSEDTPEMKAMSPPVSSFSSVGRLGRERDERERERESEREREVSHSLTLDTSHNNGFTSGAFWPHLIYQTGSPSWICLISVTHLPFLSLLSTVNDHLDIPLAATMTVPWEWLYCSLTTALITEKCSSRCGLFGGLPAGSK